MFKIQFLGAAGTVTGSSYLLTGEKDETILIDMGMFQGVDNEDTLNDSALSFDAEKLQAVFLTHAHLDHCGRLPLLIKAGFKGKVYATEATKMITHISLLDAAAIQDEEKEKIPLYTKDDVEKIYEKIEIVEYNKQFAVGEFQIIFRNAGHILGSSSIEISDKSQTIVFSGDLGNTPENLIQPTEYISRADVVIMESTYGDKVHPREDAVSVFKKEIEIIEQTRGVLLIPAFSIERTQEILHLLSHLEKNNILKKSVPVFLDSPMAIEVTEVFKEFRNLYSDDLLKDLHPFDFSSLKYTKSVEESKAILKAENPKIIIAGSGMLSGGRILHHLENYISSPTTRILIVGYQAEGTLGREILTGVKNITLYKKHLSVNAAVTKLEAFSSHADLPLLLKWLKNIQGVKKVFLTHGENLQREALAKSIKTELNINNVFLPIKEQVYEIN